MAVNTALGRRMKDRNEQWFAAAMLMSLGGSVATC